jgi:hypothetical protein
MGHAYDGNIAVAPEIGFKQRKKNKKLIFFSSDHEVRA